MTAGFLFININYVINLFDLMANLSRQFPNIRRSLETGSRVLAFLDQPLEADGASELKIEKAQVVFDDVQFAYEEGKPVLTGYCLSGKSRGKPSLLWAILDRVSLRL